MRRAAALVVGLAVLVCAASAAGAGFKALPSQPGRVDAFAASGSTWLALVGQGFGTDQPYVSRDGGAHWTLVPLGNFQDATARPLVSVAPDGAFWVPVDVGFDRIALMRMERGGATFTSVYEMEDTSGGAEFGAPDWDAQKRTWFGVRSTFSSAAVQALDASGKVVQTIPAQNADAGDPQRVRFVGGVLYADFGRQSALALRGGALERIARSTSVGPVGFPLLASGKSVLTEDGLSTDGGKSFGTRFQRVSGVAGTTQLVWAGPEGFPTLRNGGRVLRRYSPGFFAATALELPMGTDALAQVSGGLVAIVDNELQLFRGTMPQLRSPRGLPAQARAMVARANHFRRQAGLPPIVGDPKIAKASRNHSHYWASRGTSFRALGLNAHLEKKGTRGFTGVTPDERCKHVGAVCGGEVIIFGQHAGAAVDWWMATPYHRAPFIDPSTGVAGGARVGSVATMNFSNTAQSLPLTPVEYPRGHYGGPLIFSGNEAPDPTVACRQVHQPVGSTPSIPVSFVPPVNTQGAPVVELFRGKARVPGCTKVGFFMGKRPLSRHTKYRARARWQPAGGGPAQTTSWSFTTG
jgi:hypothetical protein